MSSRSNTIRNRLPLAIAAAIVALLVVLVWQARVEDHPPSGPQRGPRRTPSAERGALGHAVEDHPPSGLQRGPRRTPSAERGALGRAVGRNDRPAVPYQRGMTLGDWGPDAYAPAATRNALSDLARRGVGSVTLFTVWMQRNERASTIAPGPSTVRTARLVSAIRIARSLGLDVVLRPFVDLVNHGWRGAVRPRNPTRWWRDYRRFVLRYARVAERTGVGMYVIGSEMKSQSQRSRRWRALVSEVRHRFRGAVTYEANWDEFQAVHWWHALDVIDISGYFPLASGPGSSVQQLTAAWAGPRKRLRAAARRFRRPVMLGEVGYTTFAATAVQPWSRELGGPRDPRAQARAYQATFRAWAGVRWFRGFHWWFVPADPRRVGTTRGYRHIPRAPALDVLTHRYRALASTNVRRPPPALGSDRLAPKTGECPGPAESSCCSHRC